MWKRHYLTAGHKDVDDAEEGDDGNEEHQVEELHEAVQRLKEAHLRTVPDAGHVLLAVWMSHKLHTNQRHCLNASVWGDHGSKRGHDIESEVKLCFDHSEWVGGWVMRSKARLSCALTISGGGGGHEIESEAVFSAIDSAPYFELRSFVSPIFD